MVAVENAIGGAGIGTGVVAGGLILGPEHTPSDWTFVHQNTNTLHEIGWGFLGATALLSTIWFGIQYNKLGWVKADTGFLIFPTPRGVKAGRAHDKRRYGKNAR